MMDTSQYRIPSDHLDPVRVVEIEGNKIAYRQPSWETASAIRKKINDDYNASVDGTAYDRSEVLHNSNIRAMAATLLDGGENITEEQARVLYFKTGSHTSPYVKPALEILGLRTSEEEDPLESKSSG